MTIESLTPNIILTTYKRLDLLSKTIDSLNRQTYSDFILHVVHNDPETEDQLLKLLERANFLFYTYFRKNKMMSFERHFVAAKLAKNNIKMILMLDDDIGITEKYVETAIAQFERKTYKSAHAFSYETSPPDYTKRMKHNFADSNTLVHHCGPGVSIIDSAIFLLDGFFDEEIVEKYYMFDDIWLSIFALKNDWKLGYLDIDVKMGHKDSFSMFHTIAKIDDKRVFLDKLYRDGYICF